MEEPINDRRDAIRVYIKSFCPEALENLKPNFVRLRLEEKGMQINADDMKAIRGTLKYLKQKLRDCTIMKNRVLAKNIKEILASISDHDLGKIKSKQIYEILVKRGFEINPTMRSSLSKLLAQEKQKRQDSPSLPKTQNEEIRKGMLDLFLLANGNIELLQGELAYIDLLVSKIKKIYSS